jgi:uncharacterized protein
MRHAEAKLIYKGKDITKDIKDDFLSFTYDEKAEGEADSLTISLQNKSLKWMGAWLPQTGDQIQASLTSYDWNHPGEILKLDCGIMQVDEPTFSGPPDVFELKALNIPAAEGFNDAPEDTTWSTISMAQLGRLIANRYNMQFVYDAPKDFTIKALKRTNQTDADLLSNIAQKYNLCLKIYSNKLVLYSKHLYEQRTPIATIKRGVTSISSYSLSSPIVGTGFNAATIIYRPPKSKSKLQYTFRIAPGGKLMRLNESVDDDEQAEMVAKGKLREANEKQFTGTFTLALNLKIVAGCTVMLSGFGKFDGKYFVDTATPSYGSGAGTTNISIHKCLQGGY